MKQVVQDQSAGKIQVLDVPPPILQAEGALIALDASVISSGTERAKVEMGERSLIGKARARPDLVRKVADQVQRDGLRDTIDLVRDRLGAPQPLGYSAAGRVLQVGDRAPGLQPGQLVACGGAGWANHAEVVYVPATLCAPVPAGVAAEQAAFATIGSIALHGLRQASLHQGDVVVVSGLGLVGQLAVRLAIGYGHQVIGVDPAPIAREEVACLGVPVFEPTDAALTRVAADAVLLTAATTSDDPVAQAPTWCRDRGVVVVVGDVGLGLARAPYYDREVELRFSRSYGPGRYDSEYEERGRDYPIGYVRWTEGRNLAEVLRLIAIGRLEVEDLISERYPLEHAAAAYDRLAHGERSRALVLTYSSSDDTRVRPVVPLASHSNPLRERLRVGVCGAGNFARKTLLPGLEATGRVSWSAIATATGVSATHVGTARSFQRATSEPLEVCSDPDTDAVVIATRHDTHAGLAACAAANGKFVFVEKPLAITRDELASLEKTEGAGRIVSGFNRRWSPAALGVADLLARRSGPLLVQIRVNAGRLPSGHWADTPEQGGRLIGELCHFIDLACHLTGLAATRVSVASASVRAPSIEDTAQVLLQFEDGSSAALAYFANGGRAMAKERVELHWDGHSAVIDDFRRWQTYADVEKEQGGRRQDKGHRRLLTEFVRYSLDGGESPVPFHQAVHVTDVSLCVVEAMTHGMAVEPALAAW